MTVFQVLVFEVFCILNKNHLGVSKNNDTPKWMVKIMENPIKMDDLGGPPLFLYLGKARIFCFLGRVSGFQYC